MLVNVVIFVVVRRLRYCYYITSEGLLGVILFFNFMEQSASHHHRPHKTNHWGKFLFYCMLVVFVQSFLLLGCCRYFVNAICTSQLLCWCRDSRPPWVQIRIGFCLYLSDTADLHRYRVMIDCCICQFLSVCWG